MRRVRPDHGRFTPHPPLRGIFSLKGRRRLAPPAVSPLESRRSNAGRTGTFRRGAHHGSFPPLRDCYSFPDCQHISRHQCLDSAPLSKTTASSAIMAGTPSILPPSRRWGGRRIQRLDVGGLWSSDEARGMDTSGVPEDVDGWHPPARRALKETDCWLCHVPPASTAAMPAAVFR